MHHASGVCVNPRLLPSNSLQLLLSHGYLLQFSRIRLKLAEIRRYFQRTWSNLHQSSPIHGILLQDARDRRNLPLLLYRASNSSPTLWIHRCPPVRSQSTWNSSDWQHLSPNLVDNLERWYSDYRFVSRCTCLFLFSAFVFIISRSLNTYLIASRQFRWISVCWFFIIAHARLFLGNEHLRHRNVQPFVITGKSSTDI